MMMMMMKTETKIENLRYPETEFGWVLIGLGREVLVI